jgi:GAF domain-containing protein/DNA-binding response OmpR family regulator/HAMP domain-containing protein/two-component sensor histidine kinase
MFGVMVRKLGRLGVRLWGPFLLLAFVSILAGVVVLLATYTGQREYIANLQREVAARASLRVGDYLQAVEDSLVAGAQTLSFVEDNPGAQQLYLKSLLDANPAFFELALMDTRGREIAKVVRHRRVAPQDLVDRSASAEFLAAGQGSIYFGPVYISQFAVPFYTLAVPVHDTAGRVIGVLAAEVNFDEMWNVVNRFPAGETGYLYVVDGRGSLIVYHNLELVMRQPDVSQQVPGVQRFLAGDFDVMEYPGLDGAQVIGARQRVAGTDWGIIAELPTREAYRTAGLFGLASGVVFLVLLAVVLAMGGFITRRVVQPLMALAEGAATLGQGNLDYRIQVDATDEIKELAAEFNAMAGSLQQAQMETQARLREVSSLVEAGRTMTSLDLQHVLNTLAKEAARAMDSMACAIYILDEASQVLRPRAVWSQSDVPCDPPLRAVGEGVAGWIAKDKRSLRVEDVHRDPRFAAAEAGCHYRSVMGLPLAVGGRLVGVLLVADKGVEREGFSEDDERLLLAFADQAAVSIENAELYGAERRRSRELALISRISRTITSSLDLDMTLDAILASVRDLLPYVAAEVCLWDPHTHKLVSHGRGGDPAYRELAAGTYVPGEGYTGWIAQHREPLLIPDVNTFEAIKPKRALHQLPLGAYVGVPLMVGETFVGTLELVSDVPGLYQPQDLETLQTVANQAAVAIENARLFASAERNLREISVLHETTAALSSKLSVRDLLDTLAHRMAVALEADECTISEWDEAGGTLWAVTIQPSGDETRPVAPGGAGSRLSMREKPYLVADFPATAGVLRSHQPEVVSVSDSLADPAEVALLRELGWRSMLMLPLVTRDAVVGLVEIYDADERRFTDKEIRLAQALTSQAAVALQNAQLFSLTDAQLHKRIAELSGLQRVSQELNSTLELNHILRLVLEEGVRATGADLGNVSLHDTETGMLLASVSAGFSEEAAQHLQEKGFYAGTGVMGRVLQTGEPALVPDVSLDPDYLMISPESRSEVTVPIFYAGDVAGVINLESRQLNAFSGEQLQYLQALANQAAIAIRNARAYEEQRNQRELLRQRAEQLSRLSEISRAYRSDQPLVSVLEDIAYAINETVGFNVVLISLMQGDPPLLYRVAGAGIPLVDIEQLKAMPQSPQVVMDLMQDRFRLGLQSFFIPHTYKEVWEDRLDTYLSPPEHVAESDEQCWDMNDLCFSPLYSSEQRLVGVISVDNPRDGRVPNQETMETLELFANQAAAAVENAMLFRSEQERRRLADTLREVAAVVSSTLSVDQVMEAILDQLRYVVPYDSATVQVLRGDRLVITGGRGWANMDAVLGLSFSLDGDNPNSVVVRTRQPYIVPDTHARFADFRRPPHSHIRSWLGIPLLFGGDLLGMISLDSTELDHYTSEHAQLALTFANQVAVALQNAQLFEQAHQYADRLRLINEVGVEITSILHVDKLIDRVSQLVENNFGYYANIGLIDEGYLVWHVRYGAGDDRAAGSRQGEVYRLKVGEEGVTGWVAASGQTVVVPDVSKDPRYIPVPGVGSGRGGDTARSEVAMPLRAQDRIIGVFDVASDELDAFSENDVLVLQSLANQAAVAIVNAQLFERVSRMGQELEQRVQERTEALAKTLEDLTLERDRVETLYRITRELSASLDLDRVLAEALSLINRAVGVSHGSIMLVNPGTGVLMYRAALGRSKALPRGGKPTRFSRGIGLAGWVLENRESVIVPDVTEDSHWIPDEEESTPERKAAMAVPLTAGEDVLGVLLLFHPEVNYFSEDHLKLVSAAAAQVATAINNAELYGLITDQAERLGVMLRTQRAEAAKHQAIVDSIADGVLVLDVNRHVILMNPAAARILDLNAGDVEDRHLREILGRAESIVDQDLAQQLFDRLMSGLDQFGTVDLSPDDAAPGLDFRLEANGKVVVVKLSPALLGGGELPSLVIVLRDISREAEVERLKNEFISTVSHELRTPMTSIKGYTDLLFSERVGILSDQQRHFVRVIKNNADRLTALVNDILDISRIETGRLRLQIESLDMAALIQTVADSFRGQMVEKSLKLTLDLPSSLPPVCGDEGRVTQILENLTSNAWKYTPEGGEVTVRVRVEGHFLRVDVADTGIGIDPKDLPHVFERFFRTDQAEVQAVDGSGLGLSIVKMFVDLLGGKIWVESELNRGSTFSFTLPLVLESETGASEGNAPGTRILVVEDDEHILHLLRHQLETDGYRVLAAQRGEDALQLARSEQPALITLDILLGDIDGFQVLEQLKQDPATSQIPVIIVSVVPDAESRGLALGAAGYVGKPFEEEQVLDQVRHILSSVNGGDTDHLHQVLVVDDDRDIVDWLTEALSHSGFAVRGAYSGRDALACVREEMPDLILLDLKMPDMDGYEVIRRLRQEQTTRNIPVIVITGSTVDKGDRVKVLGMGIERMLTKPFSVETLVQEIKSLSE